MTRGDGGQRRIVADGATGFVGSKFLASALARGVDVLALNRGGRSRAQAAMRQAVLADPAADLGRLESVAFDLEQPDLGLTLADVERVFEVPCDFWHFAANTSLAPIAGALTETNVEGTRRTLEAFRTHAKPGSRYFHVSTALFVRRG